MRWETTLKTGKIEQFSELPLKKRDCKRFYIF